jgi:PAS domain S-box-containing protein
MAYLNEILFTVTTLILWGLVVISRPLVKQGTVFQPESFWFIAFAFRASAFSFFTVASSFHFGLLTLANTSLFASSLYMAFFFRCLRKPESKQSKWLPLLAILVFGLVFEYVRQRGEFKDRVFLVLTISSLCLIWQLIEIGLLGKVRLKKLKLFFFTSSVELVLVIARLGAFYFQQLPPETNLYQEPLELALIRWSWFSFTVISYVALIGYWIDRISVDNAQTIAENNSIKLAIANKKIDQSEKQLLSTLEEFKSAEVKLDVAQNELLKREELLRYVLDISGNGIWDWNILTGEVKHNTRWIEMLGEDPSKQYFSVDDFKNRIHPDDLSVVLKELSQTLEGLKDYQYRYRMIRLDGTQIWVEDKGKVVDKSIEGKPMRMVGAITDISEEVSSNQKLQALAFYDPLTKVLNRRLF